MDKKINSHSLLCPMLVGIQSLLILIGIQSMHLDMKQYQTQAKSDTVFEPVLKWSVGVHW
jgi:hypothetical protein